MTDLNSVTVVGRLTRDCGGDQHSFGYLQNGTCRAVVSIAVNRSVKRGEQWQDEASFFDVTIWGKTAENLKPYLTKGKQIAIDGYLKQDRWEKDGQKFSKVGIVAETVQLLGGRDGNGQGDGGFQQSQSGGWQQGGAYAPQNQPPRGYSQPMGQNSAQSVPQGYAPRQNGNQGGFSPQQQGFQEDIPWENADIPF